MKELEFFKIDDNGILPVKSYNGDAGYDLKALNSFVLYKDELQIVSTGIGVSMKRSDLVGIIKGRSGLATKGVQVLGGVVDSGYGGEIKIILHNVGPAPLSFKAGDRIAQIVFMRIYQETEDKGDRNEAGFGSTGL